MNTTSVYVRAAVQRAQSEGSRTVELQIADLLELLPYIESGLAKERAEGRMKPVGWISARELRTMRRDQGNHIRVSRKKSPERCMMVYHHDDLREMEAESARLMAERIEEQKNAKAEKEVANVQTA
jgi:uncharacterized membrane protein